ncbi:LysR family transcriptional regulator [Eggerthellaceae bacterium zg-1084]|uniref:LysR family transcriptional regulator n=1 Tax=Berryella wangjianweii TaxID=2734634 RepID=A0A6M8IX60_9ACTN|nr:LysR family transcriptional regulator [Berryella wangjianweii]NPD30717.1 LysR family transcriptional regulator [Berryella wangjianweii]NPD32064.1 LysR family transcriptional regulator [Eggerthellaceae bacterium zg-997]QKF07355.1 LysR family transcriptional regulator [Berryella wangjianweii]
MEQITNLRPIVRMAITCEGSSTGSMFGRGVADLCLGVREHGSLNAAAKSMGMAYSKAWRIVRDTETALGFPLLNRDGAHGSTLTPEGEGLLEAYLETDRKLHDLAAQVFEEHLFRSLGKN